MKALVTGSAGFVGRHLCPKLEAAGYDILCVDEVYEGFNVHNFICSHGESFGISPFDLIVHLAANIVNVDARMKMGLSAFDDIALDLEFLKWVEKNPPTKALVLMSSCAVDFPDDPYCIVKRNLEAMAKVLAKKGAPTIVLRPFSGYGEDQSEEYPFRAILERALRREDPLTVWGGNQVRDWIHIDDLTDAILFAAEHVKPAAMPVASAIPIEVGTMIPTALVTVADMIAEAVGYSPKIEHDTSKPSSSPYRVAGSNTTLQECGWEPKIDLEEGIRRAVAARQKEAVSA